MRITLCGSARFEHEFKDMNKRLSLEGHVVHTLACYPSDEGGKDWYTVEQKAILDEVYLWKIDNSSAILVLNVDGYIGEGCKREIRYAQRTGKRIFFLSIDLCGDPEMDRANRESESLGIIMSRWVDGNGIGETPR